MQPGIFLWVLLPKNKAMSMQMPNGNDTATHFSEGSVMLMNVTLLNLFLSKGVLKLNFIFRIAEKALFPPETQKINSFISGINNE